MYVYRNMVCWTHAGRGHTIGGLACFDDGYTPVKFDAAPLLAITYQPATAAGRAPTEEFRVKPTAVASIPGDICTQLPVDDVPVWPVTGKRIPSNVMKKSFQGSPKKGKRPTEYEYRMQHKL
jgi:hypothetical protein